MAVARDADIPVMKQEAQKFIFEEAEVPRGYRWGFVPYVYQMQLHRQVQWLGPWQSYYLLQPSRSLVMGEVHFALHDGVARSPHRAPFGAFQFADSVSAEHRFHFIQWVTEKLKANEVKRAEIVCPPAFYEEAGQSVTATALSNLGFALKEAALAAGLRVNRQPLSQRLSAWELRKLKQCNQQKLRFKKLEHAALADVYRFIAQCREERGQTLSMTMDQVKQTVAAQPSAFLLFAVFDGQRMAAASLAVRVHPQVLYTFYYAHARSFDSVSPVVKLMDGIHRWSANNQVKWIDLGTSASAGKTNFPVLQFKLNLGAQIAHKLTFEKQWP